MNTSLSTKGMGFSADHLITLYIYRLLEKFGYSDERIECALKCLTRADARTISNHVISNQRIKEMTLVKGRKKKPVIDPEEKESFFRSIRETIIDDGGKIRFSRISLEKESDEKTLGRILVEETLSCLKKKLLSCHTAKKDKIDIENELRRIFLLNDLEIELLKYAYCYELDENEFQSVYTSCTFNKFVTQVAISIGSSPSAVRKAFSNNSRLRKCGIFESSPQASRHSRSCNINDGIKEYIEGLLGEQDLLQNFVRIDAGKPYSLESFTVSKSSTEIIGDIMRYNDNFNILFHGEPGTGKTEYAKALATSTGLRPLFVNQKESGSSTSSDFNRETALIAAMNIATEKDVIIVDEADHLLNTRYAFLGMQSSMSKGKLNDIIDSRKLRIIWITNDISYIEESQLRRFTYSIQFEKFGTQQREVIWKEVLNHSKLSGVLTDKDITHLSDNYEVNAAGISNAVKVAEGIYNRKNVDAKTLNTTFDRVLTPHEELITGKKRSNRLNPVAQQYDVSVLNTDTSIDRVITSLERVVKTLNTTDKDARINANLLFYGMPGTGKTEFAKYLSEKLGKKIMVKRCSDLESMYVGETEKNIARAFREAEESGRILFIDEADTFFTERSGAMRSFEVSRTNEMLNQMENFRGIFICCTNMKKLLDDAAIRRFSFKVEFKSLRKDDRSRLFENYFPAFGTLPLEAKMRIESLHALTPGDLRAVWNSYRFSNQEDTQLDEIVEEVVREVSHKDKTEGKVVGF